MLGRAIGSVRSAAAAATTLGRRADRGPGALLRSLSLRNDLVFLIALSRNTSAQCCINEALQRARLSRGTL